MSMTDDSARQLRIRGVFADIQFLASHIPDAQVLVTRALLPSPSDMLLHLTSNTLDVKLMG